MLGVVIPSLNEEEALPALLSDLSRLDWPHQVVVSDGGSTDGTRDVVRDAGAILLESPPGRASQMNDGANALDTPWLLFLHADCRVPAEARNALAAWLGFVAWPGERDRTPFPRTGIMLLGSYRASQVGSFC